MSDTQRAQAGPGLPGPARSAVRLCRAGFRLAGFRRAGLCRAAVVVAGLLLVGVVAGTAPAAPPVAAATLAPITAVTEPGFSGGASPGAPVKPSGSLGPIGTAPATTGPPASTPAQQAPATVAPIPTPAGSSGGSGPWLLVGLLLLLVLLLGGMFALRRRPRPLAAGPPLAGPPPVRARTAGPPPPARPRTAPLPTGTPALADALRQVAAGTSSVAVAEQIDRLLGRPDTTRDDLVAACIRQRDQVRDERLRAVLLHALVGVGVSEVRADGERFDPHRHETVDRAPVADPALHDTVASTERCGYLDNGRVLRVPRVILHWAPPAGGPFPADRR